MKSADKFDELAKQAQEEQVAIVASYESQRPDQGSDENNGGLPSSGVRRLSAPSDLLTLSLP
jgi:hypothetical protein